MDDKNGSVKINIPCPTKTKQTKTRQELGNIMYLSLSCKACVLNVWKFCQEDVNRVLFAFKVGLAVVLVSMLILVQAPYEIFGTNIIWAIFTVVITFEYTVGATFNRGLNRALGSLFAGILAIAIAQVALRTSHIIEPIIIGFSIFLIGTITSFLKQWPSLVPYEYGFRVILFTYCLIIVSSYRLGNPIRTALDRLYAIAIGGIIAVLVNVFVFPIWAGEQLHKELVDSFKSVADSLEVIMQGINPLRQCPQIVGGTTWSKWPECVKKYLEDCETRHPKFSNTMLDEFPDEPTYNKCRGTLNSSAKLESLASSAKWEPPHGRFFQFFYPWSEYVKVGAALRYCAFEVMALHGVLHSEIQAPYNLRVTFQPEIHKATTDATELIRCLGEDICNMERRIKTSLLKRVRSSIEKLQYAIDSHFYLQIPQLDALNKNSLPIVKFSHVTSYSICNLSKQLENNNVLDKNSTSLPQNLTFDTISTDPPESYHLTMRRQSRRLHSWPSREVDVYDEGDGIDLFTRMRTLESTATLSLTTFTSLLIEFVARLDHLVEAVDELSKLAKFKHESIEG